MTLMEEFKLIINKLSESCSMYHLDSVAFGFALSRGLSEDAAHDFATKYYYS